MRWTLLERNVIEADEGGRERRDLPTHEEKNHQQQSTGDEQDEHR